MEKKVVEKRWTGPEEVTLIQLVLNHEDELFGALKGPVSSATGRTEQRRAARWHEIADTLNSRFTNERRSAEKVKKKFHNIKQRAKEKIDEVRKSRGKTGGGPPPPQPTPAEEALLKFCGTRPGMTGLNGIDTDADCSKPYDDSLVQATTSSTLTCNTSTTTAECTASDTAAGVSKDPDHNACCSSSVSKHVKGQRGKKRKLDAVDEATLENLRLDNDRIRGEIQIQEQKLKTLKSQQSAFDSLQLYFSFKLSSEFNVTFQSED